MSAMNYEMDSSKFIIRRDDSTVDFFRKYDELLTAAKAERLLDYFMGKAHVKSEADVEALNKTRLSFLQAALTTQSKADEASLATQIWSEITDNELYAYLYATDIIAVDPNFPTEQEVADSRVRILYNADAYLEYLEYRRETLKPLNDPARDIQAMSIRPNSAGIQFIGFGSNNQHEEIEAQDVPRIRSHKWRALGVDESKRTPTIPRLSPDDTIVTISAKLTNENRAIADTEYSKSSKHYEADVLAVATLNASILKFLLTRIEGIEATSAAPYIKLLQWDRVLGAVRLSYGSINSPVSCNELQVELGKITLGDNETITMFIHRVRNLVANIQCISEELEAKNPRIPFPEAYECSIYTAAKWQLLYPDNNQYTGHLTLLQKIIVGIQNSRLSQVSYDFNVQVLKADQTIERLIDQMIIGESALPMDKQVAHTSNVSVSKGKSNGNSSRKSNATSSGKSNGNYHCEFHSYGGVSSSHDTSKCNTINKGLTIQDPKNADWQVLKASGEHFTPRDRSNALPNASGTKRKSNWNENSSEQLCTKCLKLNSEGATIPYAVMKTHTADKCRSTKDRPVKNNQPKAEESKPDGLLSRAAVNQVVQALNASWQKKPDSSRQQHPALRDID